MPAAGRPAGAEQGWARAEEGGQGATPEADGSAECDPACGAPEATAPAGGYEGGVVRTLPRAHGECEAGVMNHGEREADVMAGGQVQVVGR